MKIDFLNVSTTNVKKCLNHYKNDTKASSFGKQTYDLKKIKNGCSIKISNVVLSPNITQPYGSIPLIQKKYSPKDNETEELRDQIKNLSTLSPLEKLKILKKMSAEATKIENEGL